LLPLLEEEELSEVELEVEAAGAAGVAVDAAGVVEDVDVEGAALLLLA
jgi:hypothetical protein